jgi:hypothetical protein
MQFITSKLAILAAFGILLLVPAMSSGMDIVPNYDPNITQAQRDILNQKIALWEERLCCDIVLNIDFSNEDLGGLLLILPQAAPGEELAIGILPSGEWLPLGVADQFEEDAQGRPTHTRIRFNSNSAVNWHYGGEPVPNDAYDFWTVANHEIVHACGFTVNYSLFAACVGDPNPDGTRPFNCDGVTATLTPEDQGTHLDPDTHPGDLMNPTLNQGERRTPSQLVIDMLRCIWPCADIPTLNEWGMIILALLLLSAGTVAVIWRRKAALARTN